MLKCSFQLLSSVFNKIILLLLQAGAELTVAKDKLEHKMLLSVLGKC